MTPLAVPLGIAAASVALLAAGTWAAHRAGRRPHPTEVANRRLHAGATAREVEADARLRYFAHTASRDEVRAAVRLHESAELDRAAARVVAELAADAEGGAA